MTGTKFVTCPYCHGYTPGDKDHCIWCDRKIKGKIKPEHEVSEAEQNTLSFQTFLLGYHGRAVMIEARNTIYEGLNNMAKAFRKLSE